MPPSNPQPSVRDLVYEYGVMVTDRRCNCCLERYLHRVGPDPRDFFLACMKCDGPKV